MNKLFVHLFVALTCFGLSVGLTNVSRLLRGGDSEVQEVRLEPAEPLYTDFAADEAELREIYREYGPAQTRHDRAFFERVEDENFMLFLHDERLTREEDIKWMMTWPKDIIYESYPDYIQIFGNSAVVRGRITARYAEGAVQTWHFIDVWVKHGHTWEIQSTTLPD